jgi:hypothetical protein
MKILGHIRRLLSSFRLIATILLVVNLVGLGCAPRPSRPSNSPPLVGPGPELPVVELSLHPRALTQNYSVSIHADGRILVTALGKPTTCSTALSSVTALLGQLKEHGFFQITDQGLAAEYQAAATSAGRGLAVADGITASLTVRTGAEAHTVTWSEPRLYSQSYPSAKHLRNMADCVDIVLVAAGQNTSERGRP